MPNSFDNLPFNDFRQTNTPQMPVDQRATLQQVLQNPKAFEENLRRTNPQAYQRAMQIRNSGNPRAAIIEMAKAQGLNPNILKMFGI
jgi:hypothetical protein